MAITNEKEFTAYILRKLGAPVIQINLDETQVEDAITDALQKFWEYHRDGSIQTAYVYKVTETDLFQNFIKFPDNIHDVVEILDGPPIESIGNWATPQWQMAQAMLVPKSALVSIRLTDYVSMQQRLSDISSVLRKKNTFSFNKYKRRLILQFPVVKDQLLAVQCYENVDPRTDPDAADAWNDIWLKAYATACTKLRWGEVLKKARGIKLPGGIELDGDTMWSEARDEMDKLEEDLRTGQQYPIEFFVG